MILGIGLVSLATLFPIGLLRLREAQRQTRSAYLTESAQLGGRGPGAAGQVVVPEPLLQPLVFLGPPVANTLRPYPQALSYDPFIQDTPAAYADWSGGNGNINTAGRLPAASGGAGASKARNQVSRLRDRLAYGGRIGSARRLRPALEIHDRRST